MEGRRGDGKDFEARGFHREDAYDRLNDSNYDDEGRDRDTLLSPPTTYGEFHYGNDIPMRPALSRSSTQNSSGYGIVGRSNTFDTDTDKRSLLTTAKHYDPWQARMNLIKLGLPGFIKTIVLSFLICISLKVYQGFGEPVVISKRGERIFNAIMIGLSLCLGLNLASSLKRFATVLRWSLLTKRYVSVEVFDLILGVETLTKVLKLMIISLPGLHRIATHIKFLKRLPWIRDARNDGTHWTWLLAAAWLLINIGAQILVALLSLFWPVDPAEGIPLLTHGDVSVADLSRWKETDVVNWYNYTYMDAAWTHGTEASQYYPVFAVHEEQNDLSSLAAMPLFIGDGFYEYRFVNRNPDHLYTQYMVSSRKIQTRASCVQLEIEGGLTESEIGWQIKGRVPGGPLEEYTVEEALEGHVTWVAWDYEFCGPRCTNFTVFQIADAESKPERNVPDHSLLLCNSTVSDVTGGEGEFRNLGDGDKTAIYGTDEWARIAAGSIAWTGGIIYTLEDRSTRSYLQGSKWSPDKPLTTEIAEDILSRFAIGAIASFDDHGVRYQVPNQPCRPIQGSTLDVDWYWIFSLLGGIIVIQLGGQLALLFFADKTIIRDDSFISLAMLLRPVVNRIGREGMNMTGEEIKQHPKLLFKRIRYDYREGKDGEPNQVDIFFEGKDMLEARKSWTPGLYS